MGKGKKKDRSETKKAESASIGAEEIMGRLLHDFSDRFPAASEPPVSLHYFEVTPANRSASLKDVLLTLFVASPTAH